MDIREYSPNDLEEVIRATVKGLLKSHWTAMPARVTEDTKDGHVASMQPGIKRAYTDSATGETKYEDHPVHPDVPIHHMGGGGVSKTFPNKKDDTGTVLYMARALDSWFQSDGTQQPMEDRMHSLADGVFLSGIRSVPRMLQQVAKDSTQTRSDDAHHIVDLHPQNGHHVKSVDPSTPVASPSFSPFTQATKFFDHLVHPTNGVAHNATDGGTTHSYGLTHLLGHVMSVVNGLHSVLAHPTDGASLNAKDLLHQVMAHPDLGSLLSAAGGQHLVQAHPDAGVKVTSSKAVSISSSGPLSLSAPPGMLSLPSGGVSGDSLGAGAAAGNVGALGGDLSGTLPNPQVVGIMHVSNANTLPSCASDAAAAAAGVVIGGLYIDTAAVAGHNLIAVRKA